MGFAQEARVGSKRASGVRCDTPVRGMRGQFREGKSQTAALPLCDFRVCDLRWEMAIVGELSARSA